MDHKYWRFPSIIGRRLVRHPFSDMVVIRRLKQGVVFSIVSTILFKLVRCIDLSSANHWTSLLEICWILPTKSVLSSKPR